MRVSTFLIFGGLKDRVETSNGCWGAADKKEDNGCQQQGEISLSWKIMKVKVSLLVLSESLNPLMLEKNIVRVLVEMMCVFNYR